MKTKINVSKILILIAAALLFSGCSGLYDFDADGAAGDFGATQGGVQDMGLARELIKNGYVPPAEAFTVEGMFSEHDLPLDGEACSTTLCLRAAGGVAPTLDGQVAGWVQVGMSSTIDPEKFNRPSLTVVACVDVSGSMGWEYSGNEEYASPGTVSRRLLKSIASKLDHRDNIAIVSYGSDVDIVMNFVPGDRKDEILEAIDSLSENGSTNMEAGLKTAFQLAGAADFATDEARVMLFTDVQPNVGATYGTEFESIAAEGENEDVSLTVFGVGVGLGQEVMNHMVHICGGNAFSLFDVEDVDRLMEDNWPWMVSPIAYYLSLDVDTQTEFPVVDAYGFPSGESGTEISMSVATVFLSRRKGGLLLRMDPSLLGLEDSQKVHINLSYLTKALKQKQDHLVVDFPEGSFMEGETYFEQPSVGRATALAILVYNMKKAAEAYAQSREEAVNIMTDVVSRISSDAQSLDDSALDPEVELAQDLLDLMRNGAEQGDMYGI